MFTMENGVPPPTKRHPVTHWPFDTMQVGQSILVPFDPDGKPPRRVYRAVYHANKKWAASGRRYVGRQVKGGVRAWRLA